MSNLLKSKFFFGVMVLAIMFVGAFALTADAQTTTVVASGYTYSGVMKAGMSGPGISTLQAALNEVNMGTTVVVDGKFGPATMAAVKKFQMSKGLVADGVVGPATGAALTAATVAVITVPSNLPAGCTSNTGFSTTTGASCAVSMTLPAGCTSSAGYSSTTGVKCSSSTGSSLPAGCTSTSGYSSTTGAKCSGGAASNDDDNDSVTEGETSISDVNLNDADDDTLNEGADEAPVAEIEFDVEDADAELVRVDVVFQSTDNQVGGEAGEEQDPWEVFDNVYILDDNGDVIAEEDASDEDNWDDADQIGGDVDADAHRIRLNVGEWFREGDNVSLWVAVDLASSVDGAESDDAQWMVAIEENGLRFTDSEDINTEEDAGDVDTEVAEFSIEEAGADSEFNVTEASDSPEAQTIEVSENSSTTETVAIFTMEADEDGGDVKLNDFPVSLTIANMGAGNFLAEVVDDVFVVIDGTEYSADQSPSTSLTTQVFTFDDIDDDDIVVSAGDEMDVEVKVKFNSQGDAAANYDNGTTITASAALGDNDVEDADSGDDLGDVDGDADAETMTLAATGISVPASSVETSTDTQGTNDTIGIFTIEFQVTAFGEDLYIAESALAAATAGTGGVEFAVDTDAGAPTSATGVLSSEADEDTAGVFTVKEGETETFTLTVTVDASAAGAHRVVLEEVWFSEDEDGVTGSQVHNTLPANDFDTEYQVINQ